MPPSQENPKTDKFAMKFKAKLRKIGNSIGIYIPRNVITSYKIGDEIELNVITLDDIFNDSAQNIIMSSPNVITKNDNHKGKKLVFNKAKGVEEWI